MLSHFCLHYVSPLLYGKIFLMFFVLYTVYIIYSYVSLTHTYSYTLFYVEEFYIVPKKFLWCNNNGTLFGAVCNHFKKVLWTTMCNKEEPFLHREEAFTHAKSHLCIQIVFGVFAVLYINLALLKNLWRTISRLYITHSLVTRKQYTNRPSFSL